MELRFTQRHVTALNFLMSALYVKALRQPAELD